MSFVNSNLSQTRSTRNSLGANTYAGSNPSPQNYTAKQSSETKQGQYLRDALTSCYVVGMPPDQAIEEFKEMFGRSPSPKLIDTWIQCDYWHDIDITPHQVYGWLHQVDRLGWLERLGGAE